MKFEDQIYLNKIAKKLWSPRKNGEASVMIGAGFSRSASSGGNPKFPLWKDLANKLSRELKQRNQHPAEGKSPLKLASEFEATFDRKELENIIEGEIPDQLYNPHEVHEILLKLPWTDVFTTNYDTLLERAAQNIFEYKYSLVYGTQDLPGKLKPRIIKLHGSIPTVKPYVITEEDYRTYPRKHAGFVNTVQQSLMENTLCMLGFSGEDPNFLQWIGWVRDNLGDSIEQVYLCGILDLTTSEKDLLIKRNIRPVDLSPLFPKENYGNNHDKRHTDAIRWFLLSLYLSKPPVKTEWPKYKAKKISYEFSDLPHIKKSHGSNIIDKDCPNLKAENIEKIIRYLKYQRLEYPGWVIAPAYSQNSIWRSNYMMSHQQKDLLEGLSEENSIILGSELAWVFDLCLFPLWDHMAKYFLNMITDINATNKETSDARCRILVSLIKYYREKKNLEIFNSLIEKLKKLGNSDSYHENECHYQQCLLYFETFEYKNLLKSLESWEVTDKSPIWILRKSGFELELGNLQSSKHLIDSALELIRKKQLADPDNYEALSAESLALYLKSIVDGNTPPRYISEGYRERFEILGNFKSDIREVAWYYADKILSADISVKPEIRTYQKFDPGVRGETYNLLGPSFNNEAYEKAYRYLRTFTELNTPFQAGTTICIDKKALRKANDVIAHQEPRWVFINLFRLGDVKEIENWYDRVRIENLKKEDFSFILNTLLNTYEECIEHLDENTRRNYALDSHLKSSCLFLSLFCFRADKDALQRIFDLSIRFFSNEIHKHSFQYFEQLAAIFKRLCYVMGTLSSENFYKLINLDNLGRYDSFIFDFYKDPVSFVKNVEVSKIDEFQKNISSNVSQLIVDIDSKKENQRFIAFQRLSFLDEVSLLTEDQQEQLMNSLFKQTDRNGFPDIKFYYKKHLAKFQKKKNDSEVLFKNYLLNSTFDRVVKKKAKAGGGKFSKAMSIGGAPTNGILIREFIYGTRNIINGQSKDNAFNIEFDIELYLHLKTELLSWWKDDKEELQSENSFNTLNKKNRIKVDLQNSIDLLVALLIPFAPKEDLSELALLLDDMNKNGISIIKAYPVLLSKGIKLKEEVFNEISRGLNSPEKVEIDQSLAAIDLWYELYRIDEVGYEYLEGAIKELIRRVINRREPGLDEAILTLNNILDREFTPVLSDSENKVLLLNALEFLYSETEFPNEMDRLSNYNSNNYFDQPNYIVNLSAKANQLSKHIYDYLKKADEFIPEILTKWEKRASQSHLPELNKVW